MAINPDIFIHHADGAALNKLKAIPGFTPLLKTFIKIWSEKTQVSYLNRKEVPYGTKNATRPDIVIQNPNGTIKAIEVKNYDLSKNLQNLKHELKRQVSERVTNLPAGSTQEIALVTKHRKYSKEFLDKVVEELQEHLIPAYGGKIPIRTI